MIFFYISLSTYLCFNIIKYKQILYHLKENKYNIKSYTKWLKKHIKEIFVNKEMLSIIAIIIALNFDLKVIGVAIVILYTVLFLLNYKKTNKLKIDRQIITRLIILSLIYIGLNIYFIIDYNSFHSGNIIGDNTVLYYLILIIISYLSYFIMWIVNILAFPIDKIKSIGGKHAKSKLKKNKTR